MPLKTDFVDEPDLNLTPMIDIVFLLIIFFMVGTQFDELERDFDVEVPEVNSAQALTSGPDELVINIRQNGELRMQSETLTAEELESRLTAAREKYSRQAVIIRGDSDVPYQHVADVLSICHRAQIRSVSLATRLADRTSSSSQ